jgi:enoyl-CoA hydratase/carnithine racemase
VQSCLAAVNALAGDDDELGWEHTGAALRAASSSADAREGVRSFLEKRSPVWTGR